MKSLKSIGLLTIVLILFQLSCTFLSESPTIAIYGDTRTDHLSHQKVVNAMMNKKPQVVFHTGDLVHHGLEPEDWEYFHQITSEMLESVDFYPCLGNHENNSPIYFENFDLPNNERWYSVEFDRMHFIILDSNWDIKPGTDQYNWLEDDFKSLEDETKFTIAIFHHPPYSTGPHDEDEMGLRETIVPLFEKYGVDAVFNGHDHAYERSHCNNIYYIITGGGGAPLYDQERKSPYSQVYVKRYHFCKLERAGDNLKVEVFDYDLNLIDEFKIKSKR